MIFKLSRSPFLTVFCEINKKLVLLGKQQMEAWNSRSAVSCTKSQSGIVEPPPSPTRHLQSSHKTR